MTYDQIQPHIAWVARHTVTLSRVISHFVHIYTHTVVRPRCSERPRIRRLQPASCAGMLRGSRREHPSGARLAAAASGHASASRRGRRVRPRAEREALSVPVSTLLCRRFRDLLELVPVLGVRLGSCVLLAGVARLCWRRQLCPRQSVAHRPAAAGPFQCGRSPALLPAAPAAGDGLRALGGGLAPLFCWFVAFVFMAGRSRPF